MSNPQVVKVAFQVILLEGSHPTSVCTDFFNSLVNDSNCILSLFSIQNLNLRKGIEVWLILFSSAQIICFHAFQRYFRVLMRICTYLKCQWVLRESNSTGSATNWFSFTSISYLITFYSVCTWTASKNLTSSYSFLTIYFSSHISTIVNYHTGVCNGRYKSGSIAGYLKSMLTTEFFVSESNILWCIAISARRIRSD